MTKPLNYFKGICKSYFLGLDNRGKPRLFFSPMLFRRYNTSKPHTFISLEEEKALARTREREPPPAPEILPPDPNPNRKWKRCVSCNRRCPLAATHCRKCLNGLGLPKPSETALERRIAEKITCGRCRSQPSHGFSLCLPCRLKRNEYQRNYERAKRGLKDGIKIQA
jgi:hypothetical protein